MRLKSYFAGTVESAICLARQEMGEDAMLVNSRKASPEARHLGAYEVVFAASAAEHIEPSKAVHEAKPASGEEPMAQSLIHEMAEMRRQLAKVAAQVSSAARIRRPAAPFNPALDDLDELLAAHGVSAELASSLLRNLEAQPAGTADETREALRLDMESRLEVSAELSPWSFETPSVPPRAIAALIGPPGAGKTAMLAKLAARYGLAAHRPTHIISYDSHRIAAGEPLRSYAAILGVSFEQIESVDALAQSLKDNARRELVLIDTPGYSSAELELAGDLGRFLSTYPHVDIHLVLSCAARSSDLSRMVEQYNFFNPAKLIFTRLDETESYGAILNESVRSGLPVSFLSTGPRIPDDLEPATKNRIVDLLIEGRRSRAVGSA